MTVQVRLTRLESVTRRRRQSAPDAHVLARLGGDQPDAKRYVRSVRQGGPCQDHALYRCQCGCVFEAPVSTSVECPHCGDAQAW
jgi:hypothetical protein